MFAYLYWINGIDEIVKPNFQGDQLNRLQNSDQMGVITISTTTL